MKHLFLFLFLLIYLINVSAQTIFSVGKTNVSKDEFLQAYKKNAPSVQPSDSLLRNYLELYINYQLKLEEARSRKLDTTQEHADEIKKYKEQVLDDHLRQGSVFQKMIDTIMLRSQKDVLFGHIFIPVDYLSDTEEDEAKEKIDSAYRSLQDGARFEDVALRYSKDPNVENNKGVIGYVNTLILPYDIETALYTTQKGRHSTPIQTRYGWHIVKNIDERATWGEVKIAQVLIAFPPDVTVEEEKQLKRNADSAYLAIRAGAAIATVAEKMSDDLLSRNNGGVIPFFTVGVYEDAFQQKAFSLQKPGALTEPFETSYGYHILQLIERRGTIDVNDTQKRDEVRNEMLSSDRHDEALNMLVQNLKKVIPYKRGSYDAEQLQQFTRNVLRHPGSKAMQGMREGTVLFHIEGKEHSIEMYRQYLVDRARSGNKPSQPAGYFFQQYESDAVLNYYKEHIERFDPAFKNLLSEFSDGSLLFAVMNENVWNKATADTTALRKFFDSNKEKYWWKKSVDAVIVSSRNEDLITKLHQEIVSNPSIIRDYEMQYGDLLQIDSSRFEIDAMPVKFDASMKLPAVTALQRDGDTEPYNFAYVVRLHEKPEPRTYEEAQGMVIGDYQEKLEAEWILQLKKKFPVKVNEKVIRQLIKN